MVYSNTTGFWYSKDGDYLAVCSNCGQVHFCFEENYNESDPYESFNIWYQNQEAFNNSSDMPVVICSACKKDYIDDISKCKLCLVDIPPKEHYSHVHEFKDTNHCKHLICNSCSSTHWYHPMMCLCGEAVSEVDMYQIKPIVIDEITSTHHSDAFFALKDRLQLEHTDNVYLYATKMCSSCYSENPFDYNKFINKISTNINIESLSCIADSLGDIETKDIQLVETYYKKPTDDAVGEVLVPAIYLQAQIKSHGYVGYFSKEIV